MLNILPILVVVASTHTVLPITVKTPELEINFMPRTPNQLGSFYEARGFPKAMRDVLSKQCFITVGILNTSKEKIWHDLSGTLPEGLSLAPASRDRDHHLRS